MTCGYYRTSSPVTALPMIMRWISDVPSKIVKLVEVRAVSAGRWAPGQPVVSTNSAQVSASPTTRRGDRQATGPGQRGVLASWIDSAKRTGEVQPDCLCDELSRDEGQPNGGDLPGTQRGTELLGDAGLRMPKYAPTRWPPPAGSGP
jgi:hypothetical protein